MARKKTRSTQDIDRDVLNALRSLVYARPDLEHRSIAKAAGLFPSTLSRMLNNGQALSFGNVHGVLRALGVGWPDLLSAMQNKEGGLWSPQRDAAQILAVIADLKREIMELRGKANPAP